MFSMQTKQMASDRNPSDANRIIEGLYGSNSWNPLDCHIASYVKSPIQLYFVSSKTSIVGRSLRHAVVDLLDHILRKSNEYIENDTTVLGTEHRLIHSRRYLYNATDQQTSCPELSSDGKIELEISSLAPTVFYQLREDIGIANTNFRQSFSRHHLKDFTNPGKSGSLMYKTYDDLFILKTLREYEARLLMQILSGYHLQLTQRATILNRYVGLYSIRFPTAISSVEVYVVVMANVFTPSLRINEIFDLKGSTMKRKLTGHLSADKLHKLKDVDFTDLYPYGIQISSNIYHRLQMVIKNDVKVLKKLNITDFSLILGIRHLDMTEDDLIQRRPSSGIAALFHVSHRFALMQTGHSRLHVVPSNSPTDLASLPIPYLKPLKMIDEEIDTKLYYNNDKIACATLPIPGIVNRSNQRVYLYLALVDLLQAYDSIKSIEQTFKKLTDPSRRLQYSVIDPDKYEKRILKFLFETVFVDAGDDFPWPTTAVNIPIADIVDESEENESLTKITTDSCTCQQSSESEDSSSNSILEFYL